MEDNLGKPGFPVTISKTFYSILKWYEIHIVVSLADLHSFLDF